MRTKWADQNELTVQDWFSGAGGSSQGMHAVPGLRVARAANHWKQAIDSHEANFPGVAHYRGDIRKAPVWAWEITDLFWASPECTNWSSAKGKKRDFDKAMQGDLLSLYAEQEAALLDENGQPVGPTKEEEESRALMEEVPLYLRGVIERGGLVKAGVVENVTDVRSWVDWDQWLNEIRKLGYFVRVIALNSMHADPRSVHRAPQSRDRLYVAYWHKSLGRHPDWDKWLRPKAFCVNCAEWVDSMQVFNKPGQDMGRYRASYTYRCPKSSCGQVVEPDVLPAAAAIDWGIEGTPIGDRPKSEECPEGLAPNTMARIRAGVEKFWPTPGGPLGDQQGALFGDDLTGGQPGPLLVPTGGTWRNGAASVCDPMATRTTRESDGLVIPPLLIPCEGRDGKKAMRLDDPLRTQTTRLETALAYAPFIIPMRGGGDLEKARHIREPLHTVSAGGNHHGLVTSAFVMRNNTPNGDPGQMCTPVSEPLRTLTAAGHQSLVTPGDGLLVPYYGNGRAKPVSEPMGTQSTRDRFAFITPDGEWDLSRVLFRMLQPHEIGRAMSFADDYIVLGSKRARVKQYGNAVTPNVAEILMCALTECITGEEISRYAPGQGRPWLALAA
ncbi:DNA cytosine methyltransferase [Streptomyces sp. NRRL S-350]|uniref:DNA cytosine methyltransferase n=1 Tax=Streptomyces sp. NRRL S-350 TaxID=1463902 RepID=UPI0004BF6500|nr:DNA cytosine methyltransferase [Streptomyces sp. NRRL S-350]